MNKKKWRRKSKSAAIYIPVGIFIVLVLTVSGMSVFLRIMEINVTGGTMYSADSVIMASGISPGDNLLFIDTDAAVRRIRTAMPYINDVVIEPSPPDKINIHLTESVAVAVVNHRNGVLLIDSSGRVLGQSETTPKGLIEIRGFTPTDAEVGVRLRAAPDSETQLRHMTEVLTAFESEQVLSSVPYLDVSNIAYISFGYTGRYTVVLGGSGNAAYKLNQLTTIIIPEIEEREPEGVIGTINMSDPTGRWTWRQSNQ